MNLVDFTAARRIPLVGRRDLLQEVEQRIRRGGAHLLYFEGEGGIGKTALLEAALEQSRREDREGVLFANSIAHEIIDLYHVDVHTPEGLIRRIIQVMGGRSFGQTTSIQEDLDRARSMGNVDLAAEKARALQTTFLEEFVALAEEGIVLAFDTIEVLERERDPFQAELGGETPILSAGEWLLTSFLPELRGNVVLLLAGRPTELMVRLDNVRKRNPYLQLRHIRLRALGVEETKEYLSIVARAEGELGDVDAEARLLDFSQERGEVVHFLTGGRPILLALVADMVAHGWTLPPSFGRTIEELQQRSAETWWQEIEWALVVRIQESPTPVGDTIRALAWLRKGATPELLARVIGLATPEGRWDIGTTEEYLEQVARLTLVKVRPRQERVFLHDEMYALLEKYVLQECSQQEKDRVYESVLDYYQDQIDDLEQAIEQAAGVSPLLYGRLRQAFVEELHYRLRHRPSLGFAFYFWRAEEAQSGLDLELDMLLRAEFLRTVGLLQETDAIAGLDLAEVEMDMAVRWGVRALFFLNDPGGALDVFDRIRERWGKSAENLGLAWVHLQLYRCVAKILRAEEHDWQEARNLLKEVEQKADLLLEGHPDLSTTRSLLWWLRTPRALPETQVMEGQRLRARILKALALNYQGYLDRQQGRYTEAVHHYQASAMLQRRLGMASLARVLINLSYAMALIGEVRHARLLTEEAERLARRHGEEYALALALNARALVEEYDGHHRVALRHTDRALKIARGLRAPRVRGLIYLTRARAHRHLFDSSDDGEVYDEQLFDEALKEANQAVNLLKNNPPDRLGALIERGCMHREMARRHYAEHQEVAAVRAAQKSQRDLERTVALAGAMDLSDQQASAWTNLGWLWYHAGQIEEAREALQRASLCIPPDYFFPSYGPLPPMARQERRGEARLPFWSTLGKAEMLKAHIALDQSLVALDEKVKRQRLGESVKHITLSLAYNEQIADEFFDLIRAEEGLHKRILQDRLNIGVLHEYAQRVAVEQGLEQPTRFQQFLDRMFGSADLWA